MQIDGIDRDALLRSINKLKATLAHAEGLLASLDGQPGAVLTPRPNGRLQAGPRRDIMSAIKAATPKSKQQKGARFTKPELRDWIMASAHRDALMKNGAPDKNDPLASWFARNADPKRVKSPLLRVAKKHDGNKPAVYELTRGLEEA